MILVGAGPGAGMITVEGVAAIEEADVLCYDDLIDPTVLGFAREECEKIRVGKRHMHHRMEQDQINELLFEKAKTGKCVVRLKGGDNLVFGRGSEEALYLMERGINVGIIPGVSSATAVPGRMGIPLTHRGMSASFTVVAGHGADERKMDYSALAAVPGTLVFLMGMHNAGEIADKLIEAGKDPLTPASVLSQGFMAGEQRTDGTLGELEKMAKGAKAPGVIMIGEVCRFRLGGIRTGALSGRRVAVTGTRRYIQTMKEALSDTGADVTGIANLRVQIHPEELPEDAESYQWIVLTSGYAADAFGQGVTRQHKDARKFSGCSFACIGRASAKRLESACRIYADLIPEQEKASALAALLAERIRPGQKVLLLQREGKESFLQKELNQLTTRLDVCSIYQVNKEPDADVRSIPDKTDYIIIPSAKGLPESEQMPDHTVIVCMGEESYKQAKSLYGDRAVRAVSKGADGVRDTLIKLASFWKEG